MTNRISFAPNFPLPNHQTVHNDPRFGEEITWGQPLKPTCDQTKNKNGGLVEIHTTLKNLFTLDCYSEKLKTTPPPQVIQIQDITPPQAKERDERVLETPQKQRKRRHSLTFHQESYETVEKGLVRTEKVSYHDDERRYQSRLSLKLKKA